MPSSSPTTLALPPFYGATRRLILIVVGVFFADAVLYHVMPDSWYLLLGQTLALVPRLFVRGELWQGLTYSFMPLDILGTLVSCFSLWFLGALLEGLRGSRWLYELFLVSSFGAALIGTLFAYSHWFGMSESTSIGAGPQAGMYGLLIAVAVLTGDTEFQLFFVIRMKARWMVVIYILYDLARLLRNANEFQMLLHLAGALSGYLYIRFAPRRGILFGLTEQMYAVRNDYYRSKRRRAAKKFEVYMGKQGKQVRFDRDGKYVDPDKNPGRDPNDKRWMN
jgi:membrane associated rhomboid family serine protease